VAAQKYQLGDIFMKNRTIVTALSALILASVPFAGAQAESITLKASHQFPGGKGDVRDEMMQMIAREVAAAKVDLTIKVFPGSSLVKPKEQWKAMQTGQIDMTSLPLDYASGSHPEFGATLMPGLVKSHAHAERMVSKSWLMLGSRVVLGRKKNAFAPRMTSRA
jgi:TRAP-type C4-dicarboxylate transport system substrate-binding protein